MVKNHFISIACACSLSLLTLSINADTQLGAYINHDGWSVSDIDKFNAETKKPLALVTVFSSFDQNWDSLNIQASNIVSRGATPVISWMPYRTDNNDVLQAITSGSEDQYIKNWIASYKSWRDSYPKENKPEIMLRFAHEFNGNWYPWANNPEKLKDAWRHLYSLFDKSGINDSVSWVWCINNVDIDDVNDITRYYPGNDVVDWTAIDGYNWGSNYSFSSWNSFDEVFSSAYVKLQTHYPEKPVLIAEVGSAEPDDLPNAFWGQDGNDADANESKEVWVRNMFSRIKDHYPAIRAVSWFNNNKELSWALNEIAHSGSPNTGLDAYNSIVVDDHYISVYNPLKDSNKGEHAPNDKKNRTNKLTGLERAMKVSQMPVAVGEKLLQREAEGFKKLSPEVLKNILRNRLKGTSNN